MNILKVSLKRFVLNFGRALRGICTHYLFQFSTDYTSLLIDMEGANSFRQTSKI